MGGQVTNTARDISNVPIAYPGNNQHDSDSDKHFDTSPLPGEGSIKLSVQDQNNEKIFECKFNQKCEKHGIDLANVKEGFFDTVQKSFKDFFDNLAGFGNNKKTKFSLDVITGVGSALEIFDPAAIAGVSVARMLATSFEIMCARLAIAFDSSADEVARTVFSGFCIVSAGIRSALPLLAEMAQEAKNPEEIFIVSVASAVMASVYLATSAVSTLLAGHSAILNSPTTAQMARKVLIERDGVNLEQNDFLRNAEASLKKISSMLKTWKKNVSANFYALAKEALMFAGAVVSCFSALARFAPVLAVPFVSIISGSVSLVVNVFETAQGIVEHSRINSELKTLRELVENGKNSPELDGKIKNMERLLHLSRIRIMKGGLNILLSVGSIILGVLPLVTSFAMPILPAILATVSMASVVVLGVAGLVVRKMNNAEIVSGSSENEGNSDNEIVIETDSDDDQDNVSGNHSIQRNGNSPLVQQSEGSSNFPPQGQPIVQFA